MIVHYSQESRDHSTIVLPGLPGLYIAPILLNIVLPVLPGLYLAPILEITVVLHPHPVGLDHVASLDISQKSHIGHVALVPSPCPEPTSRLQSSRRRNHRYGYTGMHISMSCVFIFDYIAVYTVSY